MDSAKKPAKICSEIVLYKTSTVLSFVSMLLIVALFMRMETINRRTKMNELRISDVESHMKITGPSKNENDEDEKERLKGE